MSTIRMAFRIRMPCLRPQRLSSPRTSTVLRPLLVVPSLTRLASNQRQAASRDTTSGPKTIKENIYTIPNALTLSRIAACPFLGWSILNGDFANATALLLYAGMTDWVSCLSAYVLLSYLLFRLGRWLPRSAIPDEKRLRHDTRPCCRQDIDDDSDDLSCREGTPSLYVLTTHSASFSWLIPAIQLHCRSSLLAAMFYWVPLPFISDTKLCRIQCG